ncbi:MAG: FecR domain-containing protein [Gemmatimonadaceae bacterium]
MTDDYLWDPGAPPDPEIERLEALLRPVAYAHAPLRRDVIPATSARIRVTRWAMLAAGILVATGGWYAARRRAATPWSVATVQGAPVIRSADGARSRGIVAPGGVVETDARSSAAITVGRIGRAELGPGSRLRLLGAGASEHRLSLERGTMHASIDAPPRYFLVQTASALAVDLGCVYTLSADERGNGLITVEEGEVELQHGEVRVAVLAGNSAALRNGSGPGLPFPVRASTALRRAIETYDADPDGVGALDAVLAAAGARSTITLWHLLQRERPAARERVFARLATFSPPPTAVTRERIMRGESGALQRWRTDLQPAWEIEPPLWRRAWLAMRR